MSMTLEKAIKILSELHDQCCQADSIFCTDTTGARCEAVDMAISALRAQDLQPTCNQLATDTISRQAAIDAVDDIHQEHLYKQIGDRDTYSPYSEGWSDACNRIDAVLNTLPSAQPDVAEELYRYKCYITDKEGLQHEVIHTGDIRRVTGWEI